MIWYVTAMLFLSQHMVNDLISPFSFPGHQTPQLVSHTMLTRWPLASGLQQCRDSSQSQLIPYGFSSLLICMFWIKVRENWICVQMKTRCSTVEGGKGACLQTNSWLYHQPLNHQICICKLVHRLSLSVSYWHGWCVSSPNNGIDIRNRSADLHCCMKLFYLLFIGSVPFVSTEKHNAVCWCTWVLLVMMS